VVLAVVGKDYCIPIGLEMLNIGEGEVDCALRLLKRVIKTLGKRYLDIVIADAMYCTPHFFEECERLGVIPGAVLKANQENLLNTAERQREQNAPTGTVTDKKDEVKAKVWDMPDVSWDTADKDVRVIWAELETSRPSGDEKEKKDAPGNSEEAKKRVFVFSDKLNHLPYRIMYEIGVHRWDIDAGLFMDLTKHCYLKHKSLHFSRAYENMLILRMIAYFLFMHYHYKHIDSRRKDKIKNPTSMARVLYRSACQFLKPFY